jgi:hypothetical protein
MYNNTSSPILRGGHGGNDNEITPGGHYHRPAVEDDFDTLEEHQHVQGRAVESTEVQDRLQNHRVEGDDQVGRLHAQDCAASGTKEDVGYIKGAISNELSLEEKRFQDRTRVYPQPDDERRRAHGSRQTSDNARQKPKSEKQRLVERIEEVSGFLTHLYELYYIEQDREEEQRRQRAAESKRRASEAAQQPSASGTWSHHLHVDMLTKLQYTRSSRTKTRKCNSG